MKIGLVNLPLDNNYGGNLQRYALVKVLQDMGHKPIHLYYRNDGNSNVTLSFKILYGAKQILRNILGQKRSIIYRGPFEIKMKEILRFYHRYIPHTKRLYDPKDFEKYSNYDAYIVGSDQVWREKYVKNLLNEMFLGFVKNDSARRIAYGASFGTEVNEYCQEEIVFCGELIKKFWSISVREDSGLRIYYERR